MPPSNEAAKGSRPGEFKSVLSVLGLGLVYTSAYFLPQVSATQTYFLTIANVPKVVILPSIMATLVVSIVIWVVFAGIRRLRTRRIALAGSVVILTILTVLAMKGTVEAAGFHWQDSIPRGPDLLATQQLFKGMVFLLTLAGVLLCGWRGVLPILFRALSSLGFALGALFIVRLSVAWTGQPEPSAVAPSALESTTTERQAGASAGANDPRVRPRRVVWIIFDETDFGRMYSAERGSDVHLPNFEFLSRAAVFATNANSPASATLYSIPSLLTGIPISGEGIRIDQAGVLSLERTNQTLTPFSEATSIFGALRARGLSASVLGFLHPYCNLFVLNSCHSIVWPEVGTLAAAMSANFPDGVSNWLRKTNYWENITRDSLRLLPQYIERPDSLTFVHLNIPHLPADYANDRIHKQASSDPLTEYDRNLALTDDVLGQVIGEMRGQVSREELLLVVSTDHWLRNRWYRADQPERSRPIPLIVWKVGEQDGISLAQPISTVRTSDMILEYLLGNITSQHDIARWWQRQPTSPSFIAPHT